MLILAGDTSNAACSCCLMSDNRVLAESFLSLGLTHSETFMPLLHDLMHRANVRYEDLDAFACAVGPGSFTGIRIGVSAMKTMAMVANKPIVPVSSLQALAYPYLTYAATPVAAMINARNRRVFAAAFDEGKEVVAEDAMPIEEFADRCREKLGDSRIFFCGDAADLYAEDEAFHGFEVTSAGLEGREIRSLAVATIAGQKLAKAAAESPLLSKDAWEAAFPPDALLPVYRARTAAERSLTKGAEKA